MARKKAATQRLPSKQDILAFIAENPGKVGKREIARAFNVGPSGRVALKALLRELKAEGDINQSHGKKMTPKGQLPEVVLVDLVRLDRDGDLVGRPVEWAAGGEPPRIVFELSNRARRELGDVGIGDRVLARVQPAGQNRYRGRIMKRLEQEEQPVLGLLSRTENGEFRLQPTDKKVRHEYIIAPEHLADAKPGEFVVAQPLAGRRFGLKIAKITEVIGSATDPKALSLIPIHALGIPTRFSDAAIREAEKAKPVPLGNREDLRHIPLITIDPEDARDHDDAVFAEPDDDPNNEGGWHVIVAIADVAHYVRPGSALDHEARMRGNSTYFPDRVVPMLPEALSADLCSLVEGKDRACMAVHLWFDADGNKIRHKFVRGLMRCAAGLNYRQVQQAIDGQPDKIAAEFLEPVLKPLYACHAALNKAREARQPLAIVTTERRVFIGKDGHIAAIKPREHLLSHQVIEDFMIAANVAAAEELEKRRQPCMYRVHEPPSDDKIDSLRKFLNSLDYRLAKGQGLRPMHFNAILERARGSEHERLINEVVLRTQMQAYYTPENLGHFGLNLSRYAHFTSPIRRYADVLVHRALIRGLRLGDDGLPPEDVENFEQIAEHISLTERRSMQAERDALSRFIAAYMAEHVGATFEGSITGVTRFGLFVALTETGAEGFVPIATLSDDYYEHDEAHRALVGKRSKKRFRLGDAITVRLEEATPVTGGLRFDVVGSGDDTQRRSRVGRPALSAKKSTNRPSWAKHRSRKRR
ncbi:ribonuclease R [uncultured Ferrovibrio sp.]|uniref:ribonuclease R n=1 Tax=uncultured Ferrovibrio sp. TaxID=1576913 RepID=UPI0026212D89|nr:ribonuclease R [uncultured Ferrovibrio sp.]